MKILITGDPHLWDRNILSREDTSSSTSLKKVEEVFSLASFLKVDALILTGDVFHAPVRSKIWLYKLKLLLRSSPVPIFSIFGNHDIPDGSFQNRFYTDLGNIFLDGYFHCLLPPPTFYKEEWISGISSYTPQEEYQPDSRTTVLVIHHFLAPAFNDKNILPPEQIKSLYPNVRFVIAGHDHQHYLEDSSNGFILIRPGSLMRPSASPENNRIPEVALLDTSTSSVTWYPLTSALPFDKVFNVALRQKQKVKVFSLDDFTNNVRSVKSITSSVSEAFLSKLEKIQDPDLFNYIRSDLVARGLI